MMKYLQVTDNELNFLINVSEKNKVEKMMSDSEYDEMLLKLYTVNDADKIYSVVVNYDNGATIHRMTVLCRAINEDDAFKIVRSMLCKCSDDFVSLVSVNEFDDSFVYVCDDVMKMT